MKDPNDDKTMPLPLQGETMDETDPFNLDDDTPLVCQRDQVGDKPCESCQ